MDSGMLQFQFKLLALKSDRSCLLNHGKKPSETLRVLWKSIFSDMEHCLIYFCLHKINFFV